MYTETIQPLRSYLQHQEPTPRHTSYTTINASTSMHGYSGAACWLKCTSVHVERRSATVCMHIPISAVTYA